MPLITETTGMVSLIVENTSGTVTNSNIYRKYHLQHIHAHTCPCTKNMHNLVTVTVMTSLTGVIIAIVVLIVLATVLVTIIILVVGIR